MSKAGNLSGMAHRKLGEILIGGGYLTPAQVDEVLAAQARSRGRRFGEVAIDLKLVGSRPVKWALEQ